MSSENLIKAVLDAEGITPLGRIVSGADGTEVYFVTVSVSIDAAGKQRPSNLVLHSISKVLEGAQIRAEFILRYEDAEKVESGLRATILHSHIDSVRNIFVSLNASSATVWLEPKQALSEIQLKEISIRAATFLALFDLKLDAVVLTTEQVLPTKLALLTVIRQLAPAGLTAIAHELSRRELPIPSSDWLVRRLDVLRKSGNVVRTEGGGFALTRLSLHVLGTSKDKQSPDIARLLALSRLGS